MEDEPLEETFKQLNIKTTTIFTDYSLRSRTKRFELEKVTEDIFWILINCW